MSGDGCSASCECEQNPCAFSVGASVHIDSVISRLRGGGSLTLLAGTFGCGWSVWSANGEDQSESPITIRGQGPLNTVVDCAHSGPVFEDVITSTHLRLEGLHFANSHRSGGGGGVMRAEGRSQVCMRVCVRVRVRAVCVRVCARIGVYIYAKKRTHHICPEAV